MANEKRVNIVVYEADYQRLRKRMTYGDSFATAIRHILDELDKTSTTVIEAPKTPDPMKDTTPTPST